MKNAYAMKMFKYLISVNWCCVGSYLVRKKQEQNQNKNKNKIDV